MSSSTTIDIEEIGQDDGTERAELPGFGRMTPMPALLLAYACKDIHTNGNRFQVAGETVAGRSAGADLIVDDTWMSGEHFRITIDGDTAEIEDLESSNGTFVDGRRLKGKCKLGSPALIRAGRCLFVFHQEGSPAPGAAGGAVRHGRGVPHRPGGGRPPQAGTIRGPRAHHRRQSARCIGSAMAMSPPWTGSSGASTISVFRDDASLKCWIYWISRG